MKSWVSNCTCELLGTFALTFIGAGAIITTSWTGGAPGLVGIALAHGLILAIAISATMNISGGHINPAVTVALLVTGRIGLVAGVRYIVAQCLGATLAGFSLVVIYSELGMGSGGLTGAQAVTASALGTPSFDPQVLSGGAAMMIEILLTMFLVFAVFGTAVDGRTAKIGGFGVGLTLVTNILMGGPLTGSAVNPARTFGPLLAGGSATSHLWSQHWVYWLGPIVGAVVAAVIYEALILRPSRSTS